MPFLIKRHEFIQSRPKLNCFFLQACDVTHSRLSQGIFLFFIQTFAIIAVRRKKPMSFTENYKITNLTSFSKSRSNSKYMHNVRNETLKL